MKLSSDSNSMINQCLDRLIARYSGMEEEVVTDIHFQPIFNSGEILVFNDEDEELDAIQVPELMGLNNRSALKEVETILRRALEGHRKQFESLSLLKPYSFVMVDMEKETICDLLLIDEDLIMADDELLKDLDKDLDDFLKHLLAD